MSTVVMQNVVSLDAQEMADPAPGGLRVSRTSYDYARPAWDAIGCMVIGRHLFD